MICFFFIGVDALESKLQGESELSGRRRSYPTDVEELWVLAVELLVCIQEEEVRSLDLDRSATQRRTLDQTCGQVIGEGDLLEADEVALSDTCRRVVVAVVGVAQIVVGSVLTTAQDGGDVRTCFLASSLPAVDEGVCHRGHISIVSLELRIKSDDIAEGIGEEYVEVEALVGERIAE